MTKLFLSGILLLAILTACSDRNEDDITPVKVEERITTPVSKNEKRVMIEVNNKNSARVIEDSINKPENLQLNLKPDGSIAPEDTIDPTKPDRPK